MWERCECRDEEDGEVYKEGEVFWEVVMAVVVLLLVDWEWD